MSLLLRRHYKKERVEEEPKQEKKPTNEYPIHTGGGWYELSNGEKVQGKEEAEKLEAGD